MSYYVTRIELHDGEWSDYDTLHTAMRSRGFKREILGNDGKTYHLPWAQYVIVGNYTAASVRDAAVQAVATTGKSAEVLTCKSDDLAWQGLKVAA
jgi:DNA-binding LacI/PurR family transcriptional regulator